jgi:hypothetical protein
MIYVALVMFGFIIGCLATKEDDDRAGAVCVLFLLVLLVYSGYLLAKFI